MIKLILNFIILYVHNIHTIYFTFHKSHFENYKLFIIAVKIVN